MENYYEKSRMEYRDHKKQIFFSFLKKEGLYEKYMNNFKKTIWYKNKNYDVWDKATPLIYMRFGCGGTYESWNGFWKDKSKMWVLYYITEEHFI